MKRLRMWSSVSGVAQILVNTVLQLLLVPLFITRLGASTYGIYALLMAVGNLGTFTNFGFNTSLIKFLVEQPDRARSNQDIWVTLALILSTTGTVVVGLLLSAPDVLAFLLEDVSGPWPQGVGTLFASAVVVGGLQVVAQVPSAMLDAQQKVYLTNSVQLVVGACTKIALLASLIIVPDLRIVGWLTAAGSALSLLSLAILARRTWGPLKTHGLRSSFSAVALKHLRYGRSIYAGSIMYFFYEPMTKLLLARTVGVTEVGYFDIALRVKGMLWSILERLLYPVMPLLAATTVRESAREIIEEVQRKLLLILLLLCVGAMALTEPVISLWLGTGLPSVVEGTRWIVLSYLIAALFIPLYQYLAVKDHPEKTFILQGLNVIVNLGLFAILVPMAGFQGAIWAFSGTVLVSTAVCAWFQWTILRSHPVRQPGIVVRMIWLVGGLAGSAFAASAFTDGPSTKIVVVGLVLGAAFIILVRQLDLIGMEDVRRYFGGHHLATAIVRRCLVRGRE